MQNIPIFVFWASHALFLGMVGGMAIRARNVYRMLRYLKKYHETVIK